jgi:hypothetical protein
VITNFFDFFAEFLVKKLAFFFKTHAAMIQFLYNLAAPYAIFSPIFWAKMFLNYNFGPWGQIQALKNFAYVN